MYRACSTWQYEVAAHLVERHRGGRRLGYLTGEEYAALERDEGPTEGWRVIKSHEEHPRFAAALAEGRALALYAFRDLRDVVYSMLHKRGVSFETFLRQGMIHQVLANDRFWSRRPGRITQRYEDLIARPAEGVAQIAAHLGIVPDAGEAEALAAEYSLEANRRRAAQVARRLAARGLDLDDPANRQRWDEQTLLHWNHVREGRVGDWRDRATPVERAVLARLGNRWLVEHGYPPDEPGLRLPPAWAARLARGACACALRCAALRHPAPASVAKRLLGLAPAAPKAQAPPPPHLPAHARRVEA
jgi:hypothetical protein